MRQKITLICSRAAMMLLVMMLTSVSAWADGVDYIDADGTVKNTATDDINGNDTPTVINSNNKPTTFSTGWYVVTGNVVYTGRVTFNNNVHIILADGATMSIGTSTNRISDKGIDSGSTLIIYGQSTDATTMGTLSIYTNGYDGIYSNGSLIINGGHVIVNTVGSDSNAFRINNITINNGTVEASTTGFYAFGIKTDYNITINNGHVTTTTTGSDAYAIRSINGNFYYNGGNVTTSTADGYAIDADGSCNFNWSSATDQIAIGSKGLYTNGNVIFSKVMGDGSGNFYNSTLSSSAINALKGKTLRPAFTVTYNLNSGTNNASNPAFFAAGNAAINLAAPTRSGYDFGGWYDNEGLMGTALTTIAANTTTNVELWAKWTAHALINHPAAPATCTTAGNNEYWECTVCGKYFSDAQGTTEIAANKVEVAALGHTLNQHPAVAATCTTAGNNEYWECSNCHKYFSDAAGTNEIIADSWVVSALGHNFVNNECENCHLVRIPYLDESGDTQYCTNFTVLDNTRTSLSAGWYVVNDDITYTSGITLSGNVHIILTDGKTMNIGTSESRISDVGINNGSSLTIYGQSTDATTMGTLSIYTTAKNKYAINTGVITINGGRVTANANGVYAHALKATSTNINGGIVSVTATDIGAFAIYTQGNTVITGGTVEATSTNASAIYARDNGNVTISGGNVIARAGGNAIAGNNLTISGGNVEATTTSGTTPAIYSRGNLALGWTNSTDCIKASNYYVQGTISVASGKAFCDGTTVYSGTISSSDISALAGKTLMPAIICGKTANDNVYWAFNSTTHTMTIAGTGAMKDYDWGDYLPWQSHQFDITTLVVGSGVTSIGGNTFSGYSNLTTLDISETVTKIGCSAFNGCGGLTRVVIPQSVAEIESSVFKNCTNLSEVYVLRTTSVPTLWGEAFKFNKADRKIYVYSNVEAAYETAAAWNSYANDIEPISIPYLDGNGGDQECTSYTILNSVADITGALNNDMLPAGWYVVNDDINYTNKLTLNGDVHIILVNGKTLTVTNTAGDAIRHTGSLNIYGQYHGTGAINATAGNGDVAFNIIGGNLTINDGVITTAGGTGYNVSGSVTINGGSITANHLSGNGIDAGGTVTINDGTVSAHSLYHTIKGSHITINGGVVSAICDDTNGSYAIFAERMEPDPNDMSIEEPVGTITLGCRKTKDYIYATNYYANGSVKIATAQMLTDGATLYSGTFNYQNVSDIAGKTLKLADKCGATANDNVYWAFNSTTHTLNIAGTGAMADYYSADDQPWKNSRSDIQSVVVDNGITNVSMNAFNGCGNLATVAMNCNPCIGAYAFDGIKTGATVTMSLKGKEGETGEYWMTFYKEIYKFEVPATTQIFKASLNGSKITLTELEDDKIVESGQAVVLKSTTEDITLTLTTTESTNNYGFNDLKGVSVPTGRDADGQTFVLNKGSQGIGFYKLKAGKKLDTGKAYLTYTGSLAPEFLGFGDDATSISEIEKMRNVENETFYDLQGRRMAQPTKGLYIVNGKKVVIK